MTGASRGIGKASALALADAGFDVAITARTVREGEGRAESNTVRDDTVVAVPGSLETTAAELEARGAGRCRSRWTCSTATRSSPRRRRCSPSGAASTCCSTTRSTRARGHGSDPRPHTGRARADHAGQLRAPDPADPAGRAPHGRAGQRPDHRHGVGLGAATTRPAPPGEGGWGIAYSASKAAFGRCRRRHRGRVLGSGSPGVQRRPRQRRRPRSVGRCIPTTTSRPGSAPNRRRPPAPSSPGWHRHPMRSASSGSGSTPRSSAAISDSCPDTRQTRSDPNCDAERALGRSFCITERGGGGSTSNARRRAATLSS